MATATLQEKPAASSDPKKPKMLKVPEVAEMLGYTPWTIRQWAQQDMLPGAKKMGNQWRFNKKKIEEYIDQAGGRRAGSRQKKC